MSMPKSKWDKLFNTLEHSDMFTNLIRKISRIFNEEQQAAKPVIIEKPVDRIIEKIVEKPVDRIVERPIDRIVEKFVDREVIKEKSVTPKWARPLESYHRLFQAVEQHPQLRSILLANRSDASLLTLVSNAAQWDNLLRVWDDLASQCKKGRGLTEDEQAALNACMDLYNQTLSDQQARFELVEMGVDYDYEKHSQANNKGDRIVEQLLPAIVNAAGVVVRKPLVVTK